ncbi:DNA-directed RNA polymerase I subunit RPA34 [Aspergillus lucknowensis]|uniref:DNA-directed RNA polymerase I subunit RPA34.5-domain-containing protein n=1 Tax=Aspergillus lucknowensis TaxID=176173 RepID=A0ABR4LVP0_9EURO
MAAKAEKKSKSVRAQRSEGESSSSAVSDNQGAESSSSGSDDEQSSSSAGDSDSERVTTSDEETRAPNGHSGLKPSQTRPGHPPQPYKPPFGFKSAKPQSSSSTSSILSDIQGKQVFHITAPAYLPLSKIKEVSLAGALKGEPILKHDGVQYAIPAGSQSQASESGQTLFVYDSKAKTYHSTVKNVPSYHIQEVVELPGGAEYEETTLKAAKALEKPPRKQPMHLKMRFRPVGSGDGPPQTLGSSSDESEGEEPTFKFPRGHGEEKERKRKHQQTEGDGTQSAGVPRKKSKKHSSENAGGEKTKYSKDRDGKKRKKEKAT